MVEDCLRHHYQLYRRLGRMHRSDGKRVVQHLHFAVRLAPDDPDALNGLAWLLATRSQAALRDPEMAVALAERAAALTSRRDPAILDTLATAYAAQGRYERAVATAREALSLTDGEAAREIRSRLALFLRERPYREPASRRNAANR